MSQPESVALPGFFLRRLAAHGTNVLDVLHRSGITQPDFEGRCTITKQQFFDFWHALGRDSGDRVQRLSVETDLREFSAVLRAAIFSPTLGECLQRLARYKRMVCPEPIVVDADDQDLRVGFLWFLAGDYPPAILVDRIFATIVAIVRRGIGRPLAPWRIELTRRRGNEALLTRHFGCEVRFDAPADLLIFRRVSLQEPFVTHDEDSLTALLPRLDAALDQRSIERSIIGDVTMNLFRHMRGDRPSAARTAEALRLSPRTLQRRLEAAGTSYQELLDSVRRQSARRLLKNTDLEAGEIAFLLGFQEANSFTRAFRNWEGMSPGRWRQHDGAIGLV